VTARTFWGRRWAAAAVVAAAVAAWPVFVSDEALTPTGGADLAFTLKDMNGRDVRLDEYRGRPIILNFWATWCGPCRTEIPALVDLVDQYKDQRLTVLGVSVDDSPEDLRRFAAEYRINYPVLVGLGQDKLQETYGAVMALPVTWFIRADGSIHLKHEGAATREWLETQVKALLAPAATRPE
jgi:peroxiredoxin